MMQRLMTIREVADYLRLSKVTVYKMTRQGKIPALKIGKQWRYNKSEIDSWVKQKSNSKCH
ncbi:helix-turn-helix domain-containing protein [bacterium]|nr:helix-turn-helix domain-containing protein [bacterium]